MNLRDRVTDLMLTDTRLRARDVALRLGVSEVDVLLHREGLGVQRLRPDWDLLLERLPALGRVMALTRNETAVHEQRGRYVTPEGRGPVRAMLGAGIDLRLFLSSWSTLWAVEDNGRHSLQIFDAHGDAIHKIHAIPVTDLDALAALIDALATDLAPPVLSPRPAPSRRPDAQIDVAGFQAGWRALTDTHGFFPLLRTYGVDRLQAMRLAPAGMAEPVALSALQDTLAACAQERLPLMVFVGNPGCVQIHSGLVSKVVPMEGWHNVLDADFNLHVRRDRLRSCWQVKKPTAQGEVWSLEVYDVDDELALQLFGAREGDGPPPPAWMDMLRRVNVDS